LEELSVFNKLAIGTAQFGMNYGVANNLGQVSKSQAILIVNEAFNNSIRFLDTAPVYGNSESLIGNLGINSDWNIITKIPKLHENVINEESIRKIEFGFESSLSNLKRNDVYGLMIHSSFDLLKEGGYRLYDFLVGLKNDKRIKKIGISVYDSSQIEIILNKFDIDLIQLPLNIFDQRLLKNGVLKDLKRKKIELHARSVFLQGIILQNINNLPEYFNSYLKLFKAFEDKTDALSLNKLSLAFAFVNSIPEIDRIIVGIDSFGQFKEILENTNRKIDVDLCSDLSINDERLINPGLWEL
jgi:aryl-alcohol dehydrogenase-like predicted oxidoreductase